MQNSSHFLIDVFKKRWREFKHCYQIYQKDQREENLHDLRVATRRLSSMLEVICGFYPTSHLQKVREILLNLIDHFDELHDTQIMLTEVEEVLEKYPEPNIFFEYLKKKEKHLQRQAQKYIDSVNFIWVKGQIFQIHYIIESQVNNDLDYQIHLLAVVDDAYSVLLKRIESIDRTNTATINRVRIAMKKFRYLLEAISPTVSDVPAEELVILRKYQSIMGKINDIDILLEKMKIFYSIQDIEIPKDAVNYWNEIKQQNLDWFIEKIFRMKELWRRNLNGKFLWKNSTELMDPSES